MFQKILAMVFCAIASAGAYAAAPVITDVHAQQRYPWNGKVDIKYTISGDVAATMSANGLSLPTIVVTATDKKTSIAYVATAAAVTGDTGITEGTHRITWDMALDGYTFKSDEVTFKVAIAGTREFAPMSRRYCVIDLTAGTSAESYPVTYMAAPPEGGFNTDEYKTTKMVLRLIDPGTFLMCGQYERTISKSYYCGIFPVTQKQYELITGNKPSLYKGDMRPVEQVSWETVSGDACMGKLRRLTGLNFDLPTEAQWEFACRAGTTSLYNNGGNTEADLAEVARYAGNQSDGKGGYSSAHTTVGSYQPNAWGLYDMLGMVYEWCLDCWSDLSGAPVDPGLTVARVDRGGAYASQADGCTSSTRGYSHVWITGSIIGFRLVVNPAD